MKEKPKNDVIALISGNHKGFKVGDKVRTRGDMGNFKMIIKAIHNDYYCTCIDNKLFNKKERHFNMGYLDYDL